MAHIVKNQQKRELTKLDVGKQSTLDDISFQFDLARTKNAIKSTKEIIINNIIAKIKEDELELKVDFSLFPSKRSFSKVNLDLYFQDQIVNSVILSIPQSSLLSDNLEFPQILDMNGIVAGSYSIRVEMYELWSLNEKLNFTAKEIVVEFVPQSKKSHLVKVPTVKSFAGNALIVVSSDAKSIFQEIDEDKKKESISQRDEW